MKQLPLYTTTQSIKHNSACFMTQTNQILTPTHRQTEPRASTRTSSTLHCGSRALRQMPRFSQANSWAATGKFLGSRRANSRILPGKFLGSHRQILGLSQGKSRILPGKYPRQISNRDLYAAMNQKLWRVYTSVPADSGVSSTHLRTQVLVRHTCTWPCVQLCPVSAPTV